MKERKKSAGFTLLEAVLAIALGSLILSSVSMAFLVGRRNWKESNTQAELIQQARIALHRIVSDLHYATELKQAQAPSILEFDTEGLIANPEPNKPETIMYESYLLLNRRVNFNGGAGYDIGTPIAGELLPQWPHAYFSSLVPYKVVKDAAGVGTLEPLNLGTDPLSSAVAMEVGIKLEPQENEPLEIKTFVTFRR